jgi:hypothetical protein
MGDEKRAEIDLESTGVKAEGKYGGDCDCKPIIGCGCDDLPCACPQLQDAGIVYDCDQYGKLNFHAAEATVLGTSREEFYPNIKVDGATATNTCGLEVVANKLCGSVHKKKTFKIDG